MELHVYSVTTALDIRTLNKLGQKYTIHRPNPGALCFELGEQQLLFLFRFGAIAFFNVSEGEHGKYLEPLQLGEVKKANLEGEDFVETDCLIEFNGTAPSVRFNKVILPQWDVDLLYVLAHCVAQSCRLELMEKEVDSALEETAALTEKIQGNRWRLPRRRSLAQTLGLILAMRHEMVNKLRLFHEPDSTWQKEHCDVLYKELVDFYEINSRVAHVEKMLALASETVELQLGLLDTRHSEFLEIIIIVLIAVEIVQTLLP